MDGEKVEHAGANDASSNVPSRPSREEHSEWEESGKRLRLLPDVVDSWPYRHPWHTEAIELEVGTAWYGGRFRHSKAI